MGGTEERGRGPTGHAGSWEGCPSFVTPARPGPALNDPRLRELAPPPECLRVTSGSGRVRTGDEVASSSPLRVSRAPLLPAHPRSSQRSLGVALGPMLSSVRALTPWTPGAPQVLTIRSDKCVPGGESPLSVLLGLSHPQPVATRPADHHSWVSGLGPARPKGQCCGEDSAGSELGGPHKYT